METKKTAQKVKAVPLILSDSSIDKLITQLTVLKKDNNKGFILLTPSKTSGVIFTHANGQRKTK